MTVEPTCDPWRDVEIEIASDRGVAVVSVKGEIDLSTAPLLEKKIADASAGSATTLIDLCGCDFMDSTGLHVLLRACRTIQSKGGALAVACVPQGPVARLFAVAINDVLVIYPTRDRAMGALMGDR